jgi:hypothetical protein
MAVDIDMAEFSLQFSSFLDQKADRLSIITFHYECVNLELQGIRQSGYVEFEKWQGARLQLRM